MLGLRKVRYHAAHKLSLVSFSFCFFFFLFLRAAVSRDASCSAKSQSIFRLPELTAGISISDKHHSFRGTFPAAGALARTYILHSSPLCARNFAAVQSCCFFVSGLFFCFFSFRSFVFWCTCAPRLPVSAYFAFVGVAIVRWRRNC